MRSKILAAALLSVIPLAGLVARQDADAGRKVFESRCARCHEVVDPRPEFRGAIAEDDPAHDV